MEIRCSLELSRKVLELYKALDDNASRFQTLTRLACPPGCGVCCRSETVEATVLEVLPLAQEVFRRGEENLIADAIEEREKEERFDCVLYRADDDTGTLGRCRYYPFRALVCRLFGFAARRSKTGEFEFSTCRRIKESSPHEIQRAETAIVNGILPPVFQDAFFRVGSLEPARGFRRLPINIALKEALSEMYWTSPRHLTPSQASSF